MLGVEPRGEKSHVWGTCRYRFRLLSDDKEAVEEARRALSPWTASSEDSRPVYDWHLSRTNRGWKLDPPPVLSQMTLGEGLDSPFYSELETAVLAAEFQGVILHTELPDSPLNLHGALLSRGGTAVGLVGAKESGKSTLSVALWRSGWELHSDDGFFQVEGRTVRALPRRVRVRRSSRRFFEDSFWDAQSRPGGMMQSNGNLLFHPTAYDPVRLSSVILLKAEEGELEPIDTSRAMIDLVPYSNIYYLHGINSALAGLSALLKGVRCYRMGRATLQAQCERIDLL